MEVVPSRPIDALVETLAAERARGRGGVLLMGAGCSVTAGIPTAENIVRGLAARYGSIVQPLPDKSYPAVMAALGAGQRRDTINAYVAGARLNWAHVAVAQLMKAGYLDRVLTVNFDPLLLKACALVDLYPAVYDFASSQRFKPHYVPTPAVFYLHGQSTGFVLLHTREECERHGELLRPVFEEAGAGRPWIVSGYSGENDPVFERLVAVEHDDYGLYWSCYRDEPPPAHARARLLAPGRGAWAVQGFDADAFFMTLARRLGCFPPEFVRRPFTHLDRLLGSLAPLPLAFPWSGSDAPTLDLLESVRGLVANAREVYEEGLDVPAERGGALALEAADRFAVGDVDGAAALADQAAPGSALAQNVASALTWRAMLRMTSGRKGAASVPSLEAALADAERAERLVPGNPPGPDLVPRLRVLLATLTMGDRQRDLLDRALAELPALLALRPSDANLARLHGAALVVRSLATNPGDGTLFWEGVAAVTRADALEPGDQGTLVTLAQLHRTVSAAVPEDARLRAEAEAWTERALKAGAAVEDFGEPGSITWPLAVRGTLRITSFVAPPARAARAPDAGEPPASPG